MRDGEPAGYAVYRHAQEPRGRVTLLVDFLTDPADEAGFLTLVRWVDREARAADSDKIRTFAMHEGFRKLLRRSGYYSVKSRMEFVAKVNGHGRGPGLLQGRGTPGTSRSATPIRIVDDARLRPALLVGIDTEGDNQWDAAARRRQTFDNIYALDRLHDFFARLGVRPTYLVTYPVARDARSAEVLRRLAAAVTVRSARTITRGRHRRAIRPMSIATRTRSRCRCRSSTISSRR